MHDNQLSQVFANLSTAELRRLLEFLFPDQDFADSEIQRIATRI